MKEVLESSVFFGVLISLTAYWIGVWIQKKLKSQLANPLLIAIALVIVFLLLLRVDYSAYYAGAKYLNYLLTPATICLAVPLYEKFEVLKKNWQAILFGVLSGVLTSLFSIFGLALLLHFSHAEYATFLPKSITTAIGIVVAEEYGGYPAVTTAVIAVTGIFGNVMGERMLRLLHITSPVAKGVALGTSAHAFGTLRAVQIGEVEGAMSSLSLVVAGIMTVLLAPFVAYWI